MLTKNQMKTLLITATCGWLLFGYLMLIFIPNYMDDIKIKSAQNAFNIIDKVIVANDFKTDDDMIFFVKEWFSKGATAQTGSFATICKYDRDRLLTIMSKDAIAVTCRYTK